MGMTLNPMYSPFVYLAQVVRGHRHCHYTDWRGVGVTWLFCLATDNTNQYSIINTRLRRYISFSHSLSPLARLSVLYATVNPSRTHTACFATSAQLAVRAAVEATPVNTSLLE